MPNTEINLHGEYERYLNELDNHIKLLQEAPTTIYSQEYQRELDESFLKLEQACKKFEKTLSEEEATKIKENFRKKLSPWYSKSFLMDRGLKKPRGYPGDYLTLEHIYDEQPNPASKGVGIYLDNIFMKQTLSKAVRNRKDFIKNNLASQLLQRNGKLEVLNIASGSCREWAEIFSRLENEIGGLRLACLDHDNESLKYMQERLRSISEKGKLETHNENVMRFMLRKPKKNREKYGTFDIIYSIGLEDYLSDKHLKKLIPAMRNLLKTDGISIDSFKDKRHYDKTSYDWFSDWKFVPREEGEVEELFNKDLKIPGDKIIKSWEPSGTIFFYTTKK